MMFKYMCLVLFITWYQLADCHPAGSDVSEIDSMIDKESEAYLSVEAEELNHKNVRDKRTIGFLRQLFPNLSQIVDRKIQQVTRFLFRVIGRLVLRGGNGGGTAGGAAAGGGGGDSGGRRISITLPTYPPSADDEDEEEQTEVPSVTQLPTAPQAVDTRSGLTDAVSPSDTIAVTNMPVAASDSAPVASADSNAVAADSVPAASSTDVVVASTTAATAAVADADATTTVATNPSTTTTTTTITPTTTTTTAPADTKNAPTTQMPSDSDNTVGTGIVKRTVREVTTEKSTSSAKKRSPLTDTDENDVSTAPDNNVLTNTSDDDDTTTNTETEDPRNKRFLFNLRGGGGGGSGNFLFDMIRRGADRAARAAGGFYRVVAGTDPNTLTLAQPLQYPSLIAGSGANQDRDESSNAAPVERDTETAQDVQSEVNAKEDGYSVGVPGPLTRIFVIANRGVANVIQDLILRLAQTTERIVNFKARLITSLI